MSSYLKEKHFIVTVALATTKSVIQLKYIAPNVQIKILHLRYDHFAMNGITHFDCLDTFKVGYHFGIKMSLSIEFGLS